MITDYKEIVDKIKRDYTLKQEIQEVKRINYERALYQKHNKLEQLENEKRKLKKQYTIQGDLEENQKLIDKIKNISEEKEKYAKENNIMLEFTPSYNCEICKDTGKVKGAYINGVFDMRGERPCVCYKQRIYEKAYGSYNVIDSKENLNDFEIEHLEEKQGQKLMRIIKAVREYIIQFNEPEKTNRNICFLGTTGVGKTKMCKCICRGLYEKGITSYLETFSSILNTITTNIAQKRYSDNERLIKTLETVDFLVIDDLGAENVTDAKLEKLTNILDKREGNKKATAFTTNLTFEEIEKIYGNRIASRIKKNMIICNMDFADYREKNITIVK